MKILSGTSNPALSRSISKQLKLRLVNTNRAVQHIQQGKISPWLLLGCSAGKKMLKSFSDEQLQMTQRFINPEYWANKFKSFPADYMLVQDTAKEARIE